MAKVCLIEQAYYSWDPRVIRQVESLASIGHEVDVICMRRPGEPAVEMANGIGIIRLPMRKRRGGKLSYLAAYAGFLILATIVVAIRQLWRRYSVVQVHSPPDTLIFAAIVPKLLGARVVMDLGECFTEFYSTKFNVPLDSPVCRAIARAEQLSIRFSDAALTCTEQQKEVFVRRGAPASKIDVVLNSADESVFDGTKFPHKERQPDLFTLICHGSIEPRYGHDTVIRAVALLKEEIPGLRFLVYGEGSVLPELRKLAEELGVTNHVIFGGYVPMEELLEAISAADAGIVAMTRDVFRDVTHCNKMYEFIAMKVPVLMSRTRSVEAYFPPNCFQYFESGDPSDLSRAIRELERSPALAAELIKQATRTNRSYRWDVQREKYFDIMEPLLPRQQIGSGIRVPQPFEIP